MLFRSPRQPKPSQATRNAAVGPRNSSTKDRNSPGASAVDAGGFQRQEMRPPRVSARGLPVPIRQRRGGWSENGVNAPQNASTNGRNGPGASCNRRGWVFCDEKRARGAFRPEGRPCPSADDGAAGPKRGQWPPKRSEQGPKRRRASSLCTFRPYSLDASQPKPGSSPKQGHFQPKTL